MIIVPTICRSVIYNSREGQLAATICKVNDDGTINLCIISPVGGTFGRANVHLQQPGENCALETNYAEWLPYTIKAMEVQEARLAGANAGEGLLAVVKPKSAKNEAPTQAKPEVPKTTENSGPIATGKVTPMVAKKKATSKKATPAKIKPHPRNQGGDQ